MRSILRATVIALVLAVTANTAKAQSAAFKIAYVNTQALMDAAPGRAAAEAILSKEGDGYRAQMQKEQDSINTLLAKYQKAEPTLSAAAKDAQEKAIQSLETDAQADQLKFQQAMQQHSTEVYAPIMDVVKKVLDDIRAEDGYAMILANDPQTTPIVAADKNLDITDRVVSRLKATPASAVKMVDPSATPATPAPKKPAGAPAAPAGVTSHKPPPQQ
ncbi:MAG TPA: OmpH family outer membrane protein [Gemmatimonadaceae bacterium]|jgi:outer membrane protein